MLFLERRAVLVSSLLIVGLLTICHGASAACSGDTPKSHQPQTYNFLTNSEFKRCSSYVCFYTCFESKMTGTNEDLRLHWYIPNHLAWLPPGETSLEHRIASNDRHVVVQNTCVEYGNVGRSVRAPLIVTQTEEGSAVEEAGKDSCAPRLVRKVDDKTSAQKDLASVTLPIRRFFPSDGKRPTETMLVMTGEIGFQPFEKSFKTYLNYAIEQYPGRKEGDPETLRLKPRLENETEFLGPYFRELYKDGAAQLSKKGFISFSAPVDNPNIASALFDIVDKNGGVVSTMTLPVFVRALFGSCLGHWPSGWARGSRFLMRRVSLTPIGVRLPTIRPWLLR
jgi:hypothetical protein